MQAANRWSVHWNGKVVCSRCGQYYGYRGAPGVYGEDAPDGYFSCRFGGYSFSNAGFVVRYRNSYAFQRNIFYHKLRTDVPSSSWAWPSPGLDNYQACTACYPSCSTAIVYAKYP